MDWKKGWRDQAWLDLNPGLGCDHHRGGYHRRGDSTAVCTRRAKGGPGRSSRFCLGYILAFIETRPRWNAIFEKRSSPCHA